MESIAKDLNRSVDKGGKCDIWCKNTVRYILTNEKYTGKAIFQKYYTPNAYEGLWCRLLTLKIIVGVLDKEVLIQWCFSYSQKDAKERRALVQC